METTYQTINLTRNTQQKEQPQVKQEPKPVDGRDGSVHKADGSRTAYKRADALREYVIDWLLLHVCRSHNCKYFIDFYGSGSQIMRSNTSNKYQSTSLLHRESWCNRKMQGTNILESHMLTIPRKESTKIVDISRSNSKIDDRVLSTCQRYALKQ